MKETEIEREREVEKAGRKEENQSINIDIILTYPLPGPSEHLVLLCFVLFLSRSRWFSQWKHKRSKLRVDVWGPKRTGRLVAKSRFWLEIEEFLLKNCFIIVVSCQLQSKSKDVLNTLGRKNRLFTLNLFLKQTVEGCTSAISDGHTSTFPGPGDQRHISQQLPWMPSHPGSEWWQMTSAASVLKGHLIPASVSEQGTMEPSRQVLTHRNKGAAMWQSHTCKVSPKDSLQ